MDTLQQHKISIIVPVYNCEKYLKKCVDSVLNQSYSDLELILVDDGSSDNSGSICDEYAKADKRVHVIHKENGGVSSARNAGVNCSTANYIAFVDSDDYIDSDFFERLMDTAIKTNADIVCCNSTNEGNAEMCNICIKKEELIENTASALDYYFEGYRFAYSVWAKLFKKSVISKVDFIRIKHSEDTHMMLNAFVLSQRIALIPYSGYHYLIRSDSATAQAHSINAYNDLLITTAYLLDICFDVGEPYTTYAKKKAVETIYGAVSAYVRLTKSGAENDKHQSLTFYDFYNRIENKYFLQCGLKGIAALMFKYFPSVTVSLIGLIQRLKIIFTQR